MIGIAKDYYKSGLSLKGIANKHNIPAYKIPSIVKKFSQGDFPVEEKIMAVIKVEDKWVDHIVELLERRGIDVEVPENYELLEMFESKINN